MDYFIIRSGEDGISIDGPMPREHAAAIVGLALEERRGAVVLDRVPELDKGCFWNVPEGSVLVLRGEVVGRAELTACPCGSERAFRECHGRDEDASDPPPPCAHEKVYAGRVQRGSVDDRREVERKAWVRLVRAEVDYDREWGEVEGAREERDSARQALRDLGVDVDALMEEP